MNEIFARVYNRRLQRSSRFVPDCETHIKIGANFVWAVLWNQAQRRDLLRQGWKDVGKVLLLATILNVVTKAVILAIVPYVLVRGPISRIAKMVFAARPAMKQPSIR